MTIAIHCKLVVVIVVVVVVVAQLELYTLQLIHVPTHNTNSN